MRHFQKFGGSQVLIKPNSHGTGIKAEVNDIVIEIAELRMY